MKLKLVVGLGNPGPEYQATRHNFGFLAADALIALYEKEHSITLLSGKKDLFHLWRCTFASQSLLVAKPMTYMNRSGEPLQRITHFYQIAPEEILVLHDELDLPLGKMRYKLGGSNAGHNGLKSIQQQLGTLDFHRIRLGIGKPQHYDAAHFVLGRFTASELEIVSKLFPAVCHTIELLINGQKAQAQQYCNSFSLPD